MTAPRVLIVEPDAPFGLSVAALFQGEGCSTRVVGGAAEAEIEVLARRPDLVVLRAELPDLSGFSLCARFRHEPVTVRLPVILYSSDTAPAALAEHARTPWAANGYLAMPLDTAALLGLARRFLAAATAVESADDAVIEEEPVPAPPPLPGAPPPAHAGPPPPPPPRRPVRNTLTDEDRVVVDRIFQSIADRREALLAEAAHRRPPPRRDLLQTADGRLQLLRDDLKAREAQLAQVAELWEIREREVAYAGEWLHEKDVELQGLRAEAEDLRRQLADARAQLEAREREHGASVDGLMYERVKQEKELIEVVAANERRAHELKRELRAREEALDARAAELRSAEEALAAGRRAAEEAIADGERHLAEAREAWEKRRDALAAELAEERAKSAALTLELAGARRALEAGVAVAAPPAAPETTVAPEPTAAPEPTGEGSGAGGTA